MAQFHYSGWRLIGIVVSACWSSSLLATPLPIAFSNDARGIMSKHAGYGLAISAVWAKLTLGSRLASDGNASISCHSTASCDQWSLSSAA